MAIDFNDSINVILSGEGLRGSRGLRGEKGDTGDAGSDGAAALSGPEFQFTDELITRIDYDGGAFKVLTYNADESVNTVTLTIGDDVTTKTFNYEGGNLTSITQS